MLKFLSTLTISDVLTLLGMLGTSIIFLYGLYVKWLKRPIARYLRNTDKVTEAVLGTEFEEGLVQKLDRYGKELASVKSELTHNGGYSTKDFARQTANNTHKILGMIRARDDADSESAHYSMDAHGNMIWASRTYMRLVSRTQDEMAGAGWTLTIYPEDREYVRAEWHLAFKEQREFDLEYRVYSPSAGPLKIRNIAIPIFDDNKKLILNWYGTIKEEI